MKVPGQFQELDSVLTTLAINNLGVEETEHAADVKWELPVNSVHSTKLG